MPKPQLYCEQCKFSWTCKRHPDKEQKRANAAHAEHSPFCPNELKYRAGIDPELRKQLGLD